MERGVGGQPHKTQHFNSRHRCTHTWNDPPKKGLGPAQLPPHRCRTFPLLPVQWGLASSAACECGAEQTVDHVVLHCPIYQPPPRTTRPDVSGRWDNRMAAQHKPRYLSGLAVNIRRTRSNERRRYKQTQQYSRIHQLGFIWAVSWSTQDAESPWSQAHITLIVERINLHAFYKKRGLQPDLMSYSSCLKSQRW